MNESKIVAFWSKSGLLLVEISLADCGFEVRQNTGECVSAEKLFVLL